MPVPGLKNEAQWRDDPVLSVIAARQYLDWRAVRYLDIDTTTVPEAIGRFCDKIVETLRRPWVSPEERRKQQDVDAQQRAEEERRTEAARQAEAKRQAETKRQAEAVRRAEVKKRLDVDSNRVRTLIARWNSAPPLEKMIYNYRGVGTNCLSWRHNNKFSAAAPPRCCDA